MDSDEELVTALGSVPEAQPSSLLPLTSHFQFGDDNPDFGETPLLDRLKDLLQQDELYQIIDSGLFSAENLNELSFVQLRQDDFNPGSDERATVIQLIIMSQLWNHQVSLPLLARRMSSQAAREVWRCTHFIPCILLLQIKSMPLVFASRNKIAAALQKWEKTKSPEDLEALLALIKDPQAVWFTIYLLSCVISWEKPSILVTARAILEVFNRSLTPELIQEAEEQLRANKAMEDFFRSKFQKPERNPYLEDFARLEEAPRFTERREALQTAIAEELGPLQREWRAMGQGLPEAMLHQGEAYLKETCERIWHLNNCSSIFASLRAEPHVPNTYKDLPTGDGSFLQIIFESGRAVREMLPRIEEAHNRLEDSNYFFQYILNSSSGSDDTPVFFRSKQSLDEALERDLFASKLSEEPCTCHSFEKIVSSLFSAQRRFQRFRAVLITSTPAEVKAEHLLPLFQYPHLLDFLDLTVIAITEKPGEFMKLQEACAALSGTFVSISPDIEPTDLEALLESARLFRLKQRTSEGEIRESEETHAKPVPTEEPLREGSSSLIREEEKQDPTPSLNSSMGSLLSAHTLKDQTISKESKEVVSIPEASSSSSLTFDSQAERKHHVPVVVDPQKEREERPRLLEVTQATYISISSHLINGTSNLEVVDPSFLAARISEGHDIVLGAIQKVNEVQPTSKTKSPGLEEGPALIQESLDPCLSEEGLFFALGSNVLETFIDALGDFRRAEVVRMLKMQEEYRPSFALFLLQISEPNFRTRGFKLFLGQKQEEVRNLKVTGKMERVMIASLKQCKELYGRIMSREMENGLLLWTNTAFRKQIPVLRSIKTIEEAWLTIAFLFDLFKGLGSMERMYREHPSQFCINEEDLRTFKPRFVSLFSTIYASLAGLLPETKVWNDDFPRLDQARYISDLVSQSHEELKAFLNSKHFNLLAEDILKECRGSGIEETKGEDGWSSQEKKLKKLDDSLLDIGQRHLVRCKAFFLPLPETAPSDFKESFSKALVRSITRPFILSLRNQAISRVILDEEPNAVLPCCKLPMKNIIIAVDCSLEMMKNYQKCEVRIFLDIIEMIRPSQRRSQDFYDVSFTIISFAAELQIIYEGRGDLAQAKTISLGLRPRQEAVDLDKSLNFCLDRASEAAREGQVQLSIYVGGGWVSFKTIKRLRAFSSLVKVMIHGGSICNIMAGTSTEMGSFQLAKLTKAEFKPLFQETGNDSIIIREDAKEGEQLEAEVQIIQDLSALKTFTYSLVLPEVPLHVVIISNFHSIGFKPKIQEVYDKFLGDLAEENHRRESLWARCSIAFFKQSEQKEAWWKIPPLKTASEVLLSSDQDRPRVIQGSAKETKVFCLISYNGAQCSSPAFQGYLNRFSNADFTFIYFDQATFLKGKPRPEFDYEVPEVLAASLDRAKSVRCDTPAEMLSVMRSQVKI